MNDRCETAREWLPELAAGVLAAERAAALEAHIGSCADCREELRVLSLLRQARQEPPAHLAAGIKLALAERPARVSRPWWGLAAAAVAAVALGIGVRPSTSVGVAEVPAYVAAHGDEGLWIGDDGTIAGAPALEGLTADELQALLDEISDGGSA